MFLIPSCSCLCPIHWSQVLSLEWKCSWSSGDRRCSNYIWVISKFIVYYGATYIRGLTVYQLPLSQWWPCQWHTRLAHLCITMPQWVKMNKNAFPYYHWPDGCQTIILISDGILLIRPLGTNFSEIIIEIQTFSFKKIHLKMSSGLFVSAAGWILCGDPHWGMCRLHGKLGTTVTYNTGTNHKW